MLIVVEAPSLAEAQSAQAQRPNQRQAGEIGGVAYLLAVEDVIDLPEIPADWSVVHRWGLTTLDVPTIIANNGDPVIAFLLGRAVERLGL